MVMRRSRITNRERAQSHSWLAKNLYSRRLIRLAVSSTRDCDLCTTLSIVNPLSRSEDPSLTRFEEADGVSLASGLEAPSVSPRARLESAGVIDFRFRSDGNFSTFREK